MAADTGAGIDRAPFEEFLIHEAALLDARRFRDWMALFAEDGTYWVPAAPNQESPFDQASLFYDDREFMALDEQTHTLYVNGTQGRAAAQDQAGDTEYLTASGDGGKTWHLTPQAPVPGAIFGLAYAQSTSDRKREVADEDRGRGDSRREQTKVVVTGPGGAAWTTDEGENWNPLPDVAGYWAVAFANEHDGWLVGTGGRILKITF